MLTAAQKAGPKVARRRRSAVGVDVLHLVSIDLGITHVVVLVAQALVKTAIDQRYAEVVLRLLVAIVVAQGE